MESTHQCPQKYAYEANHLGTYVKSMPSTDRLRNDFRKAAERTNQVSKSVVTAESYVKGPQ